MLAASARRSWRLVWRAAGWLTLWLTCAAVTAGPLRAQSAPWLEVDVGDDGCVDAAELSAAVSAALPQRPGGVRARASAEGEGWRIDLWHATGEHAVRTLPQLPRDCGERREALALALTLALEHAIASPPEPEPPPEPEAPNASVAAPEPPEPNRPTPPREPLTWLVGADVGGSVGELPRPAGLSWRVPAPACRACGWPRRNR